jgi:hypothetical protein
MLPPVLFAGLLTNFEAHRTEHLQLPEPLQPFRPVSIRLLNAASLAAHRLFGIDLAPLDADLLLDQACAKFVKQSPAGTECNYGIDAYGDFREGLKVFVKSLQDEADLTLIGRFFASRDHPSL